MVKKDYYEILGISKNADEREIKKAYKRLAMKYHPDRNQGDKYADTKFKEIKEAYEVLIDNNKRSAYDQYGHSAFEQNTKDFTHTTDFSDIFGDVFGDIFGGGRRSSKNYTTRGSDLRYDLEISFEESVRGTNKDIKIPTLVKCDSCYGTGTRKGYKPILCPTCNGAGHIQIRQGFLTVQQTCPNCYGEKRIIKDPCHVCHGQGRVEKYRTLSIKIPAGVDTGDRIRLSGEGEIGKHGASSGDLYIQIKVKKHSIFKREDNNLYCEVPINFSIAALGGEIEVPTVDGRVKLKIPKETQTGKVLRIRNKGVKSVRTGITGDLLCKIIVETPVNLNDKQKKLLKELEYSFDGQSGEKNSPRSKSFFDGVKKFFDELRN